MFIRLLQPEYRQRWPTVGTAGSNDRWNTGSETEVSKPTVISRVPMSMNPYSVPTCRISDLMSNYGRRRRRTNIKSFLARAAVSDSHVTRIEYENLRLWCTTGEDDPPVPCRARRMALPERCRKLEHRSPRVVPQHLSLPTKMFMWRRK